MSGPLTLRLLDAAVSDHRTRRQALVERMAADLVTYQAAANEADAIRSLYGRGYAVRDVVMLIDEARMVAFQTIVACEMGQP